MLSELLAAAQPGAYFLLTVPADLALWSEHDRAFGHYRRYDRKRFQQLWKGLAVREVFTSHYNSRLYPLVKLARQWSRLRGRTAGVAGTDFAMPGHATNALLSQCFAGERHRLVRLALGESTCEYRRGVSLMALLRREAGPLVARVKPVDVAADHYDPAAELVTAGV
jgi:hypothetical protein